MASSTGPERVAAAPHSDRRARPRHYLMTAPTFFTVSYAINPWMDTAVPVDTAAAVRQWAQLRDTYRRLGHTVDEVPPAEGLPDMVYSANAALVVGDTAIIARFAHPERTGESAHYARWLTGHGYRVVPTEHVQEGQGDLLLAGGTVLAGTGFRTDPAAHAEIAALTGLPVLSLQLTDPRYYHLDTALAVLDDTTIAYHPPAFTAAARAALTERFPHAIEVGAADAAVLGLNAVSDGANVVLPAPATGFAAQLRDAGFTPIPVPLPELLKGGGAIKCCTLELYR